MIKKIFLSFILSLLIAFGSTANAEINNGAPDFTLKDLQGNKVRLSNYRGKPVFLIFTATWCPVCIAELPHLIETYDRYKSKGLVMLNIDIMELPEKVLAFVKKRNITFPVLIDPDGVVIRKYGVLGVPKKILINPQGKIICQDCNTNTLDDKLKQLMP
jgi:peroxiredoxin